MINKIFKNIHNKYLKFFNFFFYLRYVFIIFFTAILLFLIIPKFLNYGKKLNNLNSFLNVHYNFKIEKYQSINYRIFPLPNLVINDARIKIKTDPAIFETSNVIIFLKFKDIYNLEEISPKKIILKNSNLNLSVEKFNIIHEFFLSQKNKIDFKNLNIFLSRNKKSFFNIKNINASNFGYKKNKINGIIFNNEFNLQLHDENKNLVFKIPSTGINANIDLNSDDKTNIISGSSKINIINNYIKINFLIEENIFKVTKAILNSKDLSMTFDSLIKFNPFFEINSNVTINKINENIISNLNLGKIISKKEIIKKLNNNSKINYEKKFLELHLIDKLFTNIQLEHGKLNLSGEINFSGGKLIFKADSLLLDDYPRLNFQSLIQVNDSDIFLKKVSIKKRFDKKNFNLKIVGSLNLINNKISFKEINIEDFDYYANEEDIKFFKESFQNILLKDNLFKILDLGNIKSFLEEII